MNKVLLVNYSPRSIAPYLSFYINLLKENSIRFDYITRDCLDSLLDNTVDPNQFVFRYHQPRTIIQRIRNILNYRSFVKQIVRKGYDSIICLTCYPAVILASILQGYYKGHFIVDIRDYHEFLRIKPIKNRLYKTLEKAKAVVISSEGFKAWLPGLNNIHVIHNVSFSEFKAKLFDTQKAYRNIGYVGVVDYYPQNLKIIDALANNPNYLISYHGIHSAPGLLEKYCNENNIRNVQFFGKFDNSEKERIYGDIDLVNAVYGNDSLTVTTALPNKLYDGVVFGIPIMVSQNTFLSNVVEQYNLGLSIDLNLSITEQIDCFWKEFDYNRFCKGAILFLDKCKKENSMTKSIILGLCNMGSL